MTTTKKNTNHPYMKVLEKQLTAAKLKREKLEMRISFLNEMMPEMKPYDRNEAEITIIDTQSAISALTRVINEKEAYFIKFVQQFIEDMEEVEGNFSYVKEMAYKKSESDEALKKILDKIVWDQMEKDAEAKIYCYKQLKQRIQ